MMSIYGAATKKALKSFIGRPGDVDARFPDVRS